MGPTWCSLSAHQILNLFFFENLVIGENITYSFFKVSMRVIKPLITVCNSLDTSHTFSSLYFKNPYEITCVITGLVVLYQTITTESVYVILVPVIIDS